MKFLLVICLSVAAQAYELPDLGERSATILSSQAEKKLGREFMQKIRANFLMVDDVIINDYIQKLGKKLVVNTKKNFNFFVINNPEINAFAGPDANVGIYSGTIVATHSESELAAVLAHEIAHVTQHHLEYLLERAKNAQITAAAGTIAAIIIGIVGGDSAKNVAGGATMASMGGLHQHMISFTKSKEIEADRIGMKILANSGFAPQAMPMFFSRIQRMNYDYGNQALEFLATHPTTIERIAEAKNRAKQYPKKLPESSNTYNLLRERVRVLTARHPATMVRIIQKQLSSSQASQYGYALALYTNHQLAQAAVIINKLRKQYPTEVLFQMAAAQMTTANNALEILRAALQQHPGYYPLLVQYGETLLQAKQAQTARNFLKAKAMQYGNDAQLYYLLAQAYAQTGQKADAYQAQAKAYAIYGYKQQAKVLLQQALKTPKLSATEQAIIRAKIAQL